MKVSDTTPKLTKQEAAELRRLVDVVLTAPTQRDARLPIMQLEGAANRLRRELDGGASTKLGQVIGAARRAAGAIANKDRASLAVEREWQGFAGMAVERD